jgi:hypothetical protein
MTNLSRNTVILTAALAAGISLSTLANWGVSNRALGQEQDAAGPVVEKAQDVKAIGKRPDPTVNSKDAKDLSVPGLVGFAGMVEKDGYFENPAKRSGALLLKENLGPGKAVEFEVTMGVNSMFQLRPGAYGELTGTYMRDPADYSLQIGTDISGRSLTFTGMVYAPSPDSKALWVNDRRRDSFQYWPADNVPKQQKVLEDAGLKPVSILGRKIPYRLEYHKGSIRVYADNVLAFIVPGEGFGGPVAIYTIRDTKISGLKIVEAESASRWLKVPLRTMANDQFGDAVLEKEVVAKSSSGVPYTLLSGKQNMLNMKAATWIDGPLNQSTYYEGYDNGSPVMNDPRMPMLRVPVADYTGAHVLAYAVDEEGTTPVLTMRAGSYDVRGQTLQHDFAVRVDKKSQITGKESDVLDTSLGKLKDVFIPFTSAFAQDLVTRPTMEIELTKEVRLARRTPDPNRFRYRPIGLPSGVRIAAITLEKSPLQIKVSTGVPGNLYELPLKPKFSIRLENVTKEDQTYDITVRTRHLDGDEATLTSAQLPTLKGYVPAGQTKTIDVEPGYTKLGYYDIAFDIDMPGVQRKLVRRTTFGVIPPNTRKHVATSPFGTWDFTGGHYSSSDPDQVGPLYVKAGIRYGMFNFKLEDRQRYGVLCGHEPRMGSPAQSLPDPKDKNKTIEIAESFTKAIDLYFEKHPDTIKKVGLILHENSISGPHVMRVPDVFTDRVYKFIPNENPMLDEKHVFERLLKNCIDGARAIKAKYPDIHLRLGNGPLPTKEELLRAKFPAELFDSLGNESGTFGRAPEAQPPDYVAFGASIWMDRQMLDVYGYKEKPVTQCYEICYPNTNPGNLLPETQADYFVRHAMHSLIWGVPEIRMGCISDVGNSYRFSNWGASGICYKMPELSIKPSYIAWSTMTRMLDGAKLPRSLETGSESVYAMEFERQEPSTFVSCVWSLSPGRQVEFEFTDKSPGTIIDAQGNKPESAIKYEDGKLVLTLGPRPFFMLGNTRIKSVRTLAPSVPLVKPEGAIQVVVPAPSPSTLAVFKPVEERDAELEVYNFMTPRRKGDFELSVAKATGAIPAGAAGDHAIKVTPKSLGAVKPTLAMPMYTTYHLAKPVELKGEPTSMAIAVKGNSGWGRIIFELKDASGQTWRHLGAPQARGEISPWLLDWMPKEMLASKEDGTKEPVKMADWNTDDVWGASRIKFDGWKYLEVPLPGTFQGDYRMYWPTNSQWKYDKDGIMHYPLTVTGITVEIPEKVLKLNRYEPVADASFQFGEILAVTRLQRWMQPRSASNTADPNFDRLPLELTPRESD